MVLGIIGKIGSGKSACIKYLMKNYNVCVYSCDEIAKEMLNNNETVYEKDEFNDIFTNEKKQKECRSNFHPLVYKKIKNDILELSKKSEYKNITFIIESALPSEFLYDICDKVIFIDCSDKVKIERLKEKRSYTEEKSKKILDLQKYYDEFYKMADYVILNDTILDEFEKKIKEVMDEICVIRK